MAADRDDLAYLWDMLTAARAVEGFVRDRDYDGYLADLMLRSAVEPQIEIIGEAARCVSKEFQTAHPEIPWRSIQAQRHVLTHEYGEIKHDRIWRVATVHVPDLMAQLEPLVPNPPPDSKDQP
ncbi:MAG: DUF86 domain-containing protein [Planctomycetota bacterium]|nr:MAG: DUF86 domain-containing protein [Planctomycetota bacterium]REK21468.1 MAG: DUF86 domain-containing protein [Planctomycetota bacterium]REK40020.1 MAG: DUF86 domain-containing protein [Planctomycetota bacterium]